MSLSKIDFEFITQSDTNPVLVFNGDGKLIYLNSNAEVLLGHIKSKELFKLALHYAPHEEGSKRTNIQLHYGIFNFYSIVVGYSNRDYISLRLYYQPKNKLNSRSSQLVDADLNLLLNNAIIHFKISSNVEIKLITDLDIPSIKSDQNSLSMLFRKLINSFGNATKLDISMALDIGEYMVIDENRYKIIVVKMSGDIRDSEDDTSIKNLVNQLCINANLLDNSAILYIPLIIN